MEFSMSPRLAQLHVVSPWTSQCLPPRDMVLVVSPVCKEVSSLFVRYALQWEMSLLSYSLGIHVLCAFAQDHSWTRRGGFEFHGPHSLLSPLAWYPYSRCEGNSGNRDHLHIWHCFTRSLWGYLHVTLHDSWIILLIKTLTQSASSSCCLCFS